MAQFPFYKQYDKMDCGPSCLRMIAKHFGKIYTLQSLREASKISKEGVSLLGISEAAENIGFRTLAVKVTYQKLFEDAPTPFIVHWRQSHFIVVHKLTANKVSVADPAKGLIIYTKEEFCQAWVSDITNGADEGVALLVEPTPKFFEAEDEQGKSMGFGLLFSYLFSYKKLLFQLVLGLLVGSGLQLIFPFLTQSVVDIGINTKNINFIYLVLAAQLILFLSRTAVEFIRSWILLHISTRINISILSDFLIKLMRLPLSFFDVKMFGDIMQRIGDHHRIEAFLTNQSLSVLFSLFNLLVFGVVLATYNLPIFLVFLVGSILYSLWVSLFLKYRRILDFKRFDISSKNQSALVQLINGMQEIKLANAEKPFRWQWERIQARLFRLSLKGLAYSQYQQAGAFFLNEGKNIIITFLAAKAVIDGQMTLGAMLSVQYIIGQLNSPIEQLIQFMQTYQDAKISLERLNEIHEMSDEEPIDKQMISILPEKKSLTIQNLSYTYPGAGNEPVLENINLTIPQGKTTAIVGMSGSGKTTFLKLLLKFYEANSGEIKIGEASLTNMSHQFWRSQCGVVMQEGFVFSDTIARNIAVGIDNIDIVRLLNAVKVANIQEFIEGLPLGYNTKIGAEGNGISQGQKQRLLIARAVYKNPEFMFFDEATNSLDANNEAIILNNLKAFLLNKTVVVVAHRLSTVKNADKIVVLEKGKVVEEGTHEQLSILKGKYFELVKNQLELGN
jgi:ATP-binding cassette, subfamily B, bacterial